MARRFAKINVIMVMVIMSAMGVVMYLTAPWMIGFMTTNQNIIELGSSALRIEAFAEPMFATAIVSCSIFVSAGFTLFPSLMNLGSMWLVRIPMAYYLASRMGLDGVWVAMAFELCFRGAIFLIALSRFDFSKRRGIED
jgi:Na+-driven multidrug efflux pump